MEKQIQEKIIKLQSLEQNLQQLIIKKQAIHSQLIEIEVAIEEIKKKPKHAFKIVGAIMVSSSNEDLEKYLNEKKEILDLKIRKIEKQEEELRDKLKNDQEEILRHMDKNG